MSKKSKQVWLVKRPNGIFSAVWFWRGKKIWKTTESRERAEALRRAKVLREAFVAEFYRELADSLGIGSGPKHSPGWCAEEEPERAGVRDGGR